MDKDQLPAWGDALSGSTGAVVANALVYPLDIVKTILQVQHKKTECPRLDVEKGLPNGSADEEKEVVLNGNAVAHDEHHEHYSSTLDALMQIYQKEGLSGLYAGMPGSLMGVASTNFAYFYWYSTVRHFALKRKTTPHLSTGAELLVGAVAGALAQAFTIPIAVISTRQQTAKKGARKSILETGRDIIAEDGISGLWRGFKASLVLVVNPSITYASFQKLHELFFERKAHLSPIEAFALGAMSKNIATLVTMPLIVSKVTLQAKPKPGQPKFKAFSEVLIYILKHEGILGLYKGVGPQLGKGLIVQGLMMMIKERIDLLFVILFALIKRIRAERAAKALAVTKV